MLNRTRVISFLALGLALAVSIALCEDNMDYWLKNAKPATKPATQSATGPAGGVKPTTQPAAASRPSRPDALPGAMELSDGKILAGYLYTTADKDWEVFTEADKMIHRIPFVALLSVTANVVEDATELEWRWKEMGTPEKVYTGRTYSSRRLAWTLKLIDGTTITGAVKGQPVWIEEVDAKVGPMILAERTKGEMGEKLSDLVYVKRIVISRRMMDLIEKAHK